MKLWAIRNHLRPMRSAFAPTSIHPIVMETTYELIYQT